MKTIVMEPLCGSHIEDACAEARALARDEWCRVTFDFNGFLIHATPKRSVVSMVWEYRLRIGNFLR